MIRMLASGREPFGYPVGFPIEDVWSAKDDGVDP